MKILVADDEDVARRALVLILKHKGYDVVAAENGANAMQIVEEDDAPRMLILDWMMPGVDGVEICRRVRRRASGPYTYIIVVSAKSRSRDVLLAMEAGADEFIPKPYDVHELLARVRVGERVLGLSPSPSRMTHEVMREALASPGGEVIVRNEEAVGRILVAGGRVAWAHLSTEPGSLQDILKDEVPLSPEDAGSVIEEARVSRRSFGDVLVDWKLVDPDRLRACLRGWIAKKLRMILSMDTQSVLFVPHARPASTDMTFAVDEVYPLDLSSALDAPARRPLTTRPPPPPPAQDGESERMFEAALWDAMEIEGALSAAVLDMRASLVVANAGKPFDRDLAFAQLRVMSLIDVTGDDRADDMLVTTQSAVHLMRVVPANPSLAIYLVMRKTGAVIAMARMRLMTAAEHIKRPR